MKPTPELDKMHAVKDRSQAIGEFLEWLQQEKRLELAQWHSHTEDCQSFAIFGKEAAHPEELEDGHYHRNQCGMSDQALYVFNYSIEKILAEFFEIDLQKVDEEKRAILESLQPA